MMRTEGFRNSCEWVIWADANSHIAGKDLNLYLIVCRNQSDHPHDPRRAVLKCPNGTTFTYLVAGISPGAGRGPGILFCKCLIYLRTASLYMSAMEEASKWGW